MSLTLAPALVAGGAVAQDVRTPREVEVADLGARMDGTQVPITLSPTHHIAFPGVEYITAVDFSPDGQVAYCVVDGTAVDLWKVGLNRWPELLGGVLGLVVLVYLLVVMHVRRRAQVKGEPHCRKCNYNLTAHAPQSVARRLERVRPSEGTLCPECGVDISRKLPKRGRGVVRRLWFPTTVCLLCIGAYAWLLASGAPRTANAPNAPEFWLAAVDRYAEKTQTPWLIKHRTRVYRILRVDTTTGQTLDGLRTTRSFLGHGLRVSPDGRYLAVADSLNRLSWISTRTGWRRSQLEAGLRTTGGNEGVVVAIEGDLDPCVYVRCMDSATSTSRLVAWHPNSGQQHVLIEEPAYVITYANGTKSPLARRYALVGRPDQMLVASAPDFAQAYYEQKYSVTVWGAAGGPEAPFSIQREISVPGGRECCSSPLVSTFGSTQLFVQNYRGTQGFDAVTGESLGTLTAGLSGGFSPGDFVASARGDRLFLETHYNTILVRDIKKLAWAARLKYPAPFIAPDTFVSRDGRWLAATPFKSVQSTTPRGPYIHELFLYDLSAIEAAQEPGVNESAVPQAAP